jgi:hypothetical protein
MPDTQLTATHSRRAWILAACLIAALVLAGCFPLVAGKAVPLWDAGEYFGPLFSLISDHAKAGCLMLWNPWINGGSPDFAEPQLGSSSPVLLAFALLSPNPFHSFIAYWIAVWIFGGIGMMLLCRHLGAPVWGALVVALGFVACGVYTGNAEHTSWIYSLSFLPWIVWRFDKGLLERRYWFVVQAAVLWGLSAQGGYPGVTITDPMFLTLWAIVRLWVDRDDHVRTEPTGAPPIRDFPMSGIGMKRSPLHFILSLVILGIIGIAVMSPAYASFLRENRGFTVRASSLDRQFSLSSGVLPPSAYATLASPYLYLLRLPDHRTIWPETDVSMTNIYMGVLVIVLALAALARPSLWRLWLAGLAIFFGCCAVGNHLPVRGWLYDLVPPTRYFRMPSLFRMYVILTAGALASYAARDLDDDWRVMRGRTSLVVFAISGVAGVTAVFAYAATLHSVQQTMDSASFPLFHLLFTWSAAGLLFLLAWRGVLPRKVMASCLIVLAVFDAGSTLSICTPTMYSVDGVPQWKAMDVLHIASLNLLPKGWDRTFLPPPAVGASINDRNVALKIAGFSNRTPLKNTFFQQYLADQTLTRIAVGSQRIWFSDHPVWLSPTDANFGEFVKASHALTTPPMVLHSPEEMIGVTRPSSSDRDWLESARPMVPARAELVAYLPNALTFRYHADRDGWLLITDRWAGSWSAQVNGRSQPVSGGDFIFRAVPVVSGDNLIDFRYQPRGYLPLVGLSWSVVAFVVIWQVWLLVAQHRQRS